MSAIRWYGPVWLAVVAFGAALWAGAPPLTTRKDEPEVKKLLIQRRDLLRDLEKVRREQFKTGRGSMEDILGATRKRVEVELELAETHAARIAALEDLLRVAAQIDDLAKARNKVGRMELAEVLEARDIRLKCEIDLRRAGGKPPKDVPPAEINRPD